MRGSFGRIEALMERMEASTERVEDAVARITQTSVEIRDGLRELREGVADVKVGLYGVPDTYQNMSIWLAANVITIAITGEVLGGLQMFGVL